MVIIPVLIQHIKKSLETLDSRDVKQIINKHWVKFSSSEIKSKELLFKLHNQIDE